MHGLAIPAALRRMSGGREISDRFISNTLVQMVTPTVRVALGLALTAALSRYLGVEGYGEYALSFAYVAVFSGVFSDWGLGTIVVREVSRRPDERPALLASAAALQGVVSLGSYGLMLGGLLLVGYPREVKQAIILYGLVVLLTPFQVLALAFQADLRLSRLLAPSLLGAFANFTFGIAVIALHGPLVALVAASLAALALQYAWVARQTVATFGLPARPTTTYWRQFLREAWPVGTASTLKTFWQQAPILALASVSLEGAGLFNAANKVPQQLLLIPLAVNTSTYPLLSRAWATDRAQFSRLLSRLVRASLLLVVPGVILAVGLADFIVRVLFGPAFTGAVVPFQLLIVTVGLLFPLILVAEALNAACFQRRNLVVLVLVSPVLLILLLLLVPRGGASGAALALVLGFAAYAATVFLAARGAIGRIVQGSSLFAAAIAAALGAAALWVAAPLGPLLASILGAGTASAAGVLVSPAWRRHVMPSLRGAEPGDDETATRANTRRGQ